MPRRTPAKTASTTRRVRRGQVEEDDHEDDDHEEEEQEQDEDGEGEGGEDEEEESGDEADEEGDNIEEDEDGFDEDEDEDGDEEDEEDEEMPELLVKTMSRRANRGNRLKKLLEDGGEDPNEFWENVKDVFEEGEADSDFESAESSEDVIDSDFDLPEDEVNEEDLAEVGEEEDKRLQREGRKAPVSTGKRSATAAGLAGTSSATRPAKRVKLTSTEGTSVPGMTDVDDTNVGTVVDSVLGTEEGGDAGVQVARRKSSRSTTQERSAQMERMQRENALKPKRERVPITYRVMTQEEHLEEAKLTEVLNISSLAELLRIEEMQKKVAVRKPPVLKGTYTLISRTLKQDSAIGHHNSNASSSSNTSSSSSLVPIQMTAVAFNELDPLEYLSALPTPRSQSHTTPLKCAITGKPAKYRDPVSQLPYASISALKEIRKRIDQGLIKPVSRPEPFLSLTVRHEGGYDESPSPDILHMSSYTDADLHPATTKAKSSARAKKSGAK